jgi:hypothetical protein
MRWWWSQVLWNAAYVMLCPHQGNMPALGSVAMCFLKWLQRLTFLYGALAGTHYSDQS